MLEMFPSDPTTTIDVDNREQVEEVVRRLHESGVPESDVRVEFGSYPVREVVDRDFAWSMKMGALVGIPATYVVGVAMALIAGTSVTEAAWIALMPAIFCGWFFAGFVFLNQRVGAIESADHTVPEREVREVVVDPAYAAEAVAVAEELSATAA